MKKSIAMLLSLAMAASLTACGGGSKPAETPAPESPTTAAQPIRLRKPKQKRRQTGRKIPSQH